MINQKGGVFVRLSNYQIEKLYEVRKRRSNDACGANAFNILGIDRDIIETMREGRRTYGTSEDKTLQQLRRFVNKVRRKETDDKRITIWDLEMPLIWLKSPKYPTPRSKKGHKMPSESDRMVWEGWTPDQRDQVKGWLKGRIPKGYITIIGTPGHWVIAGRTKNKGDLIIIESQQGGEGGVGSTYDCGRAGIYLGDSEVIDYIEEDFQFSGNIHDSNEIYLPNAVIGLSAVNPQYKEEDYILPLLTLPRQISTWSQDGSMSQQKPKKPFGDGSGPFGKPQKPFPQSVGLDGSSPFPHHSPWHPTGGPYKPSSVDLLAPHNFGDISTIFDIDKQKKDTWKGGGFSIEELMKPRTKVIPGKFSLKK